MAVVTLKDVAREANVSVPTVSCVLRDAPNISAATKARVLKTIADLGYIPNRHARAMVGSSTHTLAVCFPGWKWFESESNRRQMEGLGEVLETENYSLHLLRIREGGKLIQSLREFYAANRMDAAVLQINLLTEADTQEMKTLPFPCIVMNSRASSPDVSGVFLDEEGGGWLATRQLIEAGHIEIGILGPLQSQHFGTLRLQGYRRALTEAGLPVHERAGRLLQTSAFLCTQEEVSERVAQARRAGVTGIFCLSDMLASQVYAAAETMKLRIPEEMSVVGYDNSEISRLLRPALTTVESPGFEIGRMTAQLALEFIKKGPQAITQRVMLPARLHTRASVAAPANR